MARLPQLQSFAPQNALIGYQKGAKVAEDQQNRNALLAAGDAASRGDYAGAASAAFKGGNLNAGVAFKGLGAEEARKELDTVARLAFAADTPEKWAQFQKAVGAKYGPERAASLGGFDMREAVIAEAQTLDSMISQRFKTQQADRAQANADRQFGLAERQFNASRSDEAFDRRAKMLELDIKNASAGGKGFENEQKLRKEFQDITKDYRTVRDAFSRLEASGKDASPAGDLSLVFNYMKLLDPGSVVRESEFATAARTGSLKDALQNYFGKVYDGEILKFTRDDFINRGRKLYQAASDQYGKTSDQYRSLAERNSLDPGNVVIDHAPDKVGSTTNDIDALKNKYGLE